MDNRAIADCLVNYAHHLESSGANLFKIRAYRRAAEAILSLHLPAADLYQVEGRRSLKDLPGIGSHLSYTIEGLICTGEFHTYDGEEFCSPSAPNSCCG